MITAQEYRDRMARLQAEVKENGMDAFLVSGEESIYYLSGVSYRPLERPFFILVWPETPATLLVPALEGEHLAAAPNVGRVETYWDYPSPLGQGYPEKLIGLLIQAARLGVEPGLTQEVAGCLRDFHPRTLPLVEALRLVKSPAEVALLRQAAHYADLAVEKVIKAAYRGVSELELFSQGRAIQTQILKETEFDVLTTSILAGAWPAPLSAQPHGVPSVTDRLKGGPHIAVSLLRVNGYSAECERTFFLEPPSREAAEAFAAMHEARRLGRELVRPGARCAEIDCRVRQFLEAEGYGSRLLHRTGHGFGLGNHESPWIAEGSQDVLQANMLVSIEPGIYLPGLGGIRHSDTLLVTDGGCEPLTRYPDDLEQLTIRSYRPLLRLWGAVVRGTVGM
jgi:Xaa-Pro dipeptidase